MDRAAITLFLVSSFISLIVNGEIIVTTNSGQVLGKQVKSILPNEKYFSFLSIPYAKPPIGELRFMRPEPHPSWEEVLNCKKERPACAQNYIPARHVKSYGFFGDEDCLHLNIHTPKLPADENPNLPVIVFLYNEMFKYSYNASKDYSPDFFMSEDVIVTTVNHRLGALGFLSYEDELLPGNNGLRDIILGLKWIQDNIQYFGGDPSKVTLMGSLGGSVIVDILLHSPQAKGLFSAAIMQSGTSWNSVYLSGKGKKRTDDLMAVLESGSGTSKVVLRNLASVDALKLAEHEIRSIHTDESRKEQVGILPFAPLVEHAHDDAVLTKLPEEGEIDIDIPIMIGYNSREGMDFCERYYSKPQYLTFANRDFMFVFPIRTNYHFKLHNTAFTNALEELKEYYFDEGYVKISKPGEYITYVGDLMQIYPMDYTVRKYANSSRAPVYYYTFDYSGELNYRKSLNIEIAINPDGAWGASSTDELCYLFICNPIRKAYIKALKEENSEEIQVLRNMVKLWTNFAKTRNPTPPGSDFTWKPASKENKECLVVNENLQMINNIHGDRIQFWDDFLERHRQKAVDGVVEDLKDEL